jgi:dihydroorotate dehydrogenase (NAD+) catalytic subunit
MPGMVIDVDAAIPVLHNRTGGVSGPALKPIAVRCVAEIAQNVEVPIIGTGGVLTGRDVVEMLMAGATAVGVGSALWYRGSDAFRLITAELMEYLQQNNIQQVSNLIGKAL